MSKLPEIASPVSAKPSVSSTQGLTTLAEQSSMGLTTLVAPLQEAVTDKLFSGSLESGSVETTPETFADKLVRAAQHRAEIISQRREAARRYTSLRAVAARQRRDAVLQKREEEVLHKVELKRDRPRILREQALQRLRGALLLTIVQQAIRAKALADQLEVGRKDMAKRRKERRAAKMVQRCYRQKRTQRMWTKFSKYARLMKRHRLRMCFTIRCWRRAYAAGVVRDFLRATNKGAKLQRVVMTYTERVVLGQSLIRQYVESRRARMKILDQIYVQLEGIIIEEERRRIVARVHEIRNLLRARLEGKADSRTSLSTQPARGKSYAEKVREEADKVELDLKYQRSKVQNLIEGHRERYELCCKYRKDTPTLMAEYDAFLKRDEEPSPQKRRPTTAPAALDQQPGERKPSVKEIIRSSRAARAGKLKKGIEVQRGRAALTAASAAASMPPIRHRRDVRPRRYRRDAVSVRSARRWRFDWCSLDAIDARGIRVARHLRDARRVARAGRRTRRPASNQKGGRSSSRGCWRGGCGPGDGGWKGARCALCGNQPVWVRLVSIGGAPKI